jgi:predicted DNA-binding transcriptional regulator AlpA
VPEEVDTSLAERRARNSLRRRTYRNRREERLEAINRPEKADLKPATVSVRELSVLTGMSPATIWRHIASGFIPSTKYLNRRLIPYSVVEKLRSGS